MRYFITLYCLFLLSMFRVHGQNPIDHWEMPVEAGNIWFYFPGTEEPPSDWKDPGFSSGTWSQGPGGIGYGDDDDATVIDPVISLYMLQTFQVPDPANLAGAMLYIDYDDAFVAYLNGTEIARGNIGVPGEIPPFDATADTDTHEAQLYQGGEPEHFALSATQLNALLTEGDNVLALQIHNANTTSSDLSAIPWFFTATTDTVNNSPTLPAWFDPDDFGFSSHLPIMAIETFGQWIPNDERIEATLKVYNNPGGQNSTFDEPAGYDGQISIKTRGASSLMFEKKSYSFETQDENGENNNVELLGLPAENDWILYGPYSDKSLMRNVLVMQLAREMGGYASRTIYCELLINQDYRGIYVLMEKIKRDKNRVDINELDNDDYSGDSLTGGYIVKLDWPDDGTNFDWHSPVGYFNGTNLNLNYQYEYPDREDILSSQEQYIKNFVSDFEQALVGSNFLDIQEGYRKYIDVNSFVDYFILNEITNNVDAYRLSNFFTKVRNSKGGKLFEGPVWDYNLGFGNADFGNAWQTWDWALYNPFVTEVIPFHLKRLQHDPAFTNLMHCRWSSLRSSTLSESHISSIIDSITTFLGPAIERNFERWDILGVHVWPNYYVGNTYADEIDYLKEFISLRFNWMDSHMPGSGNSCLSEFAGTVVVSEIKYQPADDFETGDWIELFNNGNIPVDLNGWVIKDDNNLNTFTLPPGSLLYAGQHMVICRDKVKFQSVFPGLVNLKGSFNWKLGQKDRIRVYDADGFTVCDISYRDEEPWPVLTEGAGQTLELMDAMADLNNPANWFTGCPGGSPGTDYISPCPPLSVRETVPSSLSVFPNPAWDKLNIRWNRESKICATLFAIDGKIVKQLTGKGDLLELKVSDVDAGFYFLHVTTDKETFRKSIIIE